jgi:DNA polymerase-3 subunit delta'
MPWNRVIHQPRAVDALAHALQTERVANTYLFHGPAGVGKRTAALAFAEALLCERRFGADGPASDACGRCLACTRAARLVHPDVRVYLPFPRVSKPPKDERPPDYPERLQRLALDPYAPTDYRHRAKLDESAPSNLQVQHRKVPMDDLLRREMQYKPVEGRYVVGLVVDADRLLEAAANSLLKLLEEPGAQVVLILTAERIEQVMPTIVSRSVSVAFSPLPPEAIEAALVEREGMAPGQAAFLARMADGSLTRALDLRQSPDLPAQRTLALDFVRQSFVGRPDRLAPLIEQAAKLGRESLKEWLSLVLVWVRDLVLARAAGPGAALVNVDQQNAVEAFVRQLPGADLAAMVDVTTEARRHIEHNANPTLVLTVLAFALGDAMRGRPRGSLYRPLAA